ncbi:DUF975 family protein [Tichowtungia aerotolerans]|uniref:DUF975 family protein n=1 Tax=Tichowtungia aerotolerans TaxID=2697043 RepID=A0A6P1MF21_9BACT|nr:DUF975 family protein [Tichowtungia aerotolerans]QHI69675.1 DUF975 family protein [Tichowtungia aerotolerans]
MKSITPIRELTATARAGLSGCWGRSIGVMLVYFLLLSGSSQVPFAGGVLQLIFTAPLVVGLNLYFLQTIRKGSNPFALLFGGFDRFGTAWCAHMLVVLIIFAWMIPFVVVGGAAAFFVHPDPAVFPGYTMTALYVLIGLLAAVVLIPVQMRYALVLYVVADDSSARAVQSIQRSAALMKGNYWRLALLWLRFVGWQVLAVLTLGIGFLWVVPYMSAATAAFYDDLTRNG